MGEKQSSISSEKPGQQVIVRLELTKPAKEQLESIADSKGMPQSTVTARLIEWFARQDEILQTVILGHYPREIAADVAQVILKRFRTGQRDKTRRLGR